MDFLKLFDGYKSVISGVGLVGLGVYQFSQGQYETALQSVMAGLAVLGLRHAIAKSAAQ